MYLNRLLARQIISNYAVFLVHFFQQPENIIEQENQRVTITCLHNGTTRPPIWFINGMKNTLANVKLNPTYQVRGPYSIYFESTYLLQSTSYQCQVSAEDQTYNSQIGYLTVGEQVCKHLAILCSHQNAGNTSNFFTDTQFSHISTIIISTYCIVLYSQYQY